MKKIKFFVMFCASCVIAFALYQLLLAPMVEALEIDKAREEVWYSIEQAKATEETEQAIAEVEEIEEASIPEDTSLFPIDSIRTVDVTAMEKEYLAASAVGIVSIPSVGIEVALRYGTQYVSNIDSAAGVTEFSTEDRLYVLGHNYTSASRKDKMFHNLLEAELGDDVIITLLVDGNVIEYRFEIVSSQWCSEEDYLADNASILTNNQEYDGEYELVLATCNHKPGCKGRQIYLCSLVSVNE